MTAISVRNVYDPSIRKLIRSLVRWSIREIIGPRINLYITIVLTNLRETDKCSGVCEWIDDNINPREFKITIDNTQSLREQLRTITHEMIHVKQYAKNELYDYIRDYDKTRWKDKIFDTNKTKYKDLPWEKEAYNLQTPILRKFMKDKKINMKEYKHK